MPQQHTHPKRQYKILAALHKIGVDYHECTKCKARAD